MLDYQGVGGGILMPNYNIKPEFLEMGAGHW